MKISYGRNIHGHPLYRFAWNDEDQARVEALTEKDGNVWQPWNEVPASGALVNLLAFDKAGG